MPSGRALGNQVCDLCVSSLGFIKPGHQSVVPFLVFSLIEGDVSVLLDVLFDELGSDVDFSFQLLKFTLKGRGIEALGKDLLVYGYKLFLLVNYLIGGPEEQFFYFILGECRGGAFLTIELVIALTDDLPVGVVAVPDLRPVPAAAISALDLAGKDADRALAVPSLFAGSHQGLNHLEGLRIDNGLVICTFVNDVRPKK